MTEPTDNQLDTTQPPRKRRPRAPLPASALFTQKPWERLGGSRSWWFGLRAAGKTPPGVQLPGRKTPVWRIADLDEWAATFATVGTRRRRKSPAN